MHFKYLFKCLFKDNTILEQTQSDISQSNPQKSAFYDIQQRLGDVMAFALYNTETKDEYLVDLRDGHFEINQVSFKVYCEDNLSNIRLIYFRRHVHLFNVGAANEETSHKVSYNFGFQAVDSCGKNVKHIITLY